MTFAIYLHEETCQTTKEVSPEIWVGNSFPHYAQLRALLAQNLGHYPSLPLRQANRADYATVHDADYLDQLVRLSADLPVSSRPHINAECSGMYYCWPGYLYSLGGMMAAVDAFQANRLKRAFTFSLGGHHSLADKGHGYCILNPQAAVARYAQTKGFKNILIIDWDIHHGDGTQAIFANDPTVHCLSIHSLADLYMSKASSLEFGTTEYAQQVGHTNIPLLHAAYEDDLLRHLSFDSDYYRAAQSIEAFCQALINLPFKPDLILIFAGCDAHRDDCGEELTDWVEQDFKTLTEVVNQFAAEHDCPILSTQGGGYNLETAVASTIAHVETLANGAHR